MEARWPFHQIKMQYRFDGINSQYHLPVFKTYCGALCYASIFTGQEGLLLGSSQLTSKVESSTDEGPVLSVPDDSSPQAFS